MANVTYITPGKSRRIASSSAFDPGEYPQSSGCYLMYGADGRLLYVGKAVNLRRRLGSYFRGSVAPHRKAEMIRRIRAIEVFLVRNEREALVLESNLIRRHAPTYNSRFTQKGDSYYYVAMTDEAFPRVVPYRRERANYALDGSGGAYDERFGPYVGWKLRNDLLHAVRSVFPIRTCHRMPARMCERGQSGNCLAPCEEGISEREYRGLAQRVRHFLRRPPEPRLRVWRQEMKALAAEQAYNEARRLRDWIRAAEHARLPQVTELDRTSNLDVVWAAEESAAILEVRNGDTIGLRLVAFASGETVSIPPGCDLVGNDAARAHLPNTRLAVPRTAASRRGQLLEIARLNHAHFASRSSSGDAPVRPMPRGSLRAPAGPDPRPGASIITLRG